MSDAPETKGLPPLGLWRWIFVVAIVLFWTIGQKWNESARHFGYEIFPVLLILALIGVSPIVAFFDLSITKERLKLNEISRDQYNWRRMWAFGLLVNFAIVILIINFSR
jgi:hypothetical protein